MNLTSAPTEKPSSFAILAVTGLVTGNLIGAGILALPIILGLSGMGPSLAAMVVYGSLMFFSAIVLAREATSTRDPNFDYPSLYGRFLGPIGKWLAVGTNMLILYGLLTAYITGGSKILVNLLGMNGHATLVLLVFAAILTILAALDLSVIQKYNVALMIVMLLAFLALVFYGETKAVAERMDFANWYFIPAAVPIVVTAFHFHNIIPTICGDLKWNASAIWKAILGGMIIAFIMNAAWVQVGICCLPLAGENSILASYHENVPATVPMSNLLHSHFFILSATVFSMFAIVTSFLANGIGLQSFVRDLLGNTFRVQSRKATLVLTFLPPLLVSIIWPDIFLKAIDLVGGVGIVTLFGILPSLVAVLKHGNPRWLKSLGLLFLVLSVGALVVEIGQETGLTNLHPDAKVESWNNEQHKMPLQLREQTQPATSPEPVVPTR